MAPSPLRKSTNRTLKRPWHPYCLIHLGELQILRESPNARGICPLNGVLVLRFGAVLLEFSLLSHFQLVGCL